MRVWRIVRRPYLEQAFSGEGAALNGGRWNPIDTPLSYTSEHLSLAALELFVHAVTDEEPDDLMAVEGEYPMPPAEVTRQQAAIREALPPNWREDLPLTRQMGLDFVRAAKSAIMLVPSIVVDVEWNVLLNPAHAEFAKLKVVSSRPFRFDERMFRR